MSIENIAIVVVIVSFLLLLIPENKPPKIEEWYYDSKKHLICIIIKDKGIHDLYFIYINGNWYDYPNGTMVNKYWSNICNNLLKNGKPM